MMNRRWYALLVETDSYAPGAHFLSWDYELKRELDRRGISYEMAKGFNIEAEALRHIQLHGDQVVRDSGTERQRKARVQGGRCWYCGRKLNMDSVGHDDSAEIEHQTPQSRKLPVCSENRNKVTSCRACNNPAGNGKGDRTVQEFRAHLLRSMPGKTHLFFYGEWLNLVKLAAAGKFGENGLSRVTYQSILRPDRALYFPQQLVLDHL